MDLERTHARFDDTRWSLIDALHSPDPASRSRAVAALYEIYWPPIYAFLRHTGLRREQAAEIAQAFFHEVVLGRKLLESSHSSRGRLRSLILVALKRFVIDQSRRAATRARIGGSTDLPNMPSLDGEESILGPAADAEVAFDRRCALSIIHAAIDRTREHFQRSGKHTHWAAFECRVLRPAASTLAPPPLAAVAADHGFLSPADAAAAIQFVRKRLKISINELASQTFDPESGDLRQLAVMLG